MHVHCNGGASGHVMNFYLTAGKIIHNVFWLARYDQLSRFNFWMDNDWTSTA
jgi:hypothetical protein